MSAAAFAVCSFVCLPSRKRTPSLRLPFSVQDLPDVAAMERISECWRPFRSLGSYFLWKVEVPRGNGAVKKKKKV